jgi:hypothetical protein
MNLTQRKDENRIPIVGLLGGIAAMLIGVSTFACSEKPEATQAPAEAVAKITAPAPAPSPTDPAAALPAEIRAQIPAGAVLKEVITGGGAITSPEDGAESHQRHPYDLPDGAAGIAAVVTWEDTAWKEIEIAVGIGLCPHRGRKLESTRSSSGTAALHHSIQADEALAEDKWFLHVNADAGLAANAGKSLPYSYAVYSY